MSKMAYLFAAVSLLSSCNYDDTKLWDAVNSQEERISALEKWSEEVNAQLKALQTLIQCEDFVTSVEPVMKDGRQVGYKINFHSAESITLYTNSEGMVEGTNTPDVVPVQLENGRWVWQVNGEILTNPENGDYIYVDACTPQLKTDEQGNVQLSVDGGKTWTTISDANGNVPGEHQMVTVDESTKDKGYITIKISNVKDGEPDSEIKLPVWSDLAAALEAVKDKWVLSPKANSTVKVELSDLKDDGAIMVANAKGLTATVEGKSVNLTMNASNSVAKPYFTIMVSDGWNQTIVRNIYPKMQIAANDLASGCANGCKYISVTGNVTDKDLATLLSGIIELDLSAASGKINLQDQNNNLMTSLKSVNFVPENGGDNSNEYDFTGWPFKGCTSLTEVKFPQNLNATEYTLKGFENIGATEFIVPEGIKTAGNATLKSCINLKRLVLPSTIRSIWGEFGKANTNLTEVVIYSTVIPEFAANTPFTECNASLKFYVPDEAYDAYIAAWGDSGNAANKPASITTATIKKLSELPSAE